MKYEVSQGVRHAWEWRAEAIEYERDGAIYTVLFHGPRAEERALEYAAWKNSVPQTQTRAET